jgi:hypothetical protein
MENGGPTNAAPESNRPLSLRWIPFTRKVHRVGLPHIHISIWLGPKERQSLLQSKTLNTKSRQGDRNMKFRAQLKPGQQNFASLLSAHKDQRSGHSTSRSSRVGPTIPEQLGRDALSTWPRSNLFVRRVFRHRGARSPPASKFGRGSQLRPSTP